MGSMATTRIEPRRKRQTATHTQISAELSNFSHRFGRFVRFSGKRGLRYVATVWLMRPVLAEAGGRWGRGRAGVVLHEAHTTLHALHAHSSNNLIYAMNRRRRVKSVAKIIVAKQRKNHREREIETSPLHLLLPPGKMCSILYKRSSWLKMGA